MNAGQPSSNEGPRPMRAHRKSRKGCRNCKARKVKCDEKRPLCTPCARHYANIDHCEYEFPPEVSFVAAVRRNAPNQPPSSSRSELPNVPESLQGLDPFYQHPPTAIPNPSHLLQHYLYTIVLRSFPFFNTKNIVDIWWPFLRNDELLFNVVLYLSAESLESLQPGEASSSANVLMTHCIRLLRERVAEPGLGTTNETIVAVANLMAIEHGKGNMRSLKMHMDGLKRMVTARGGLNALRDSSPMTANMAFWMSMIASNQPESLPLAFDTNDELHGSPSDRAITHLDSDEYNAEEATSVILQQANRMSQMFTVTVNSASTEEGLSVLDHLSSLIQTLLQLAPKADTDRTITRLLESCRYAAALHVFFPLCGFYPDPTLMVSTLVHDLKSSLEFYMVFLALHANLVLWMFFVGGVSAWAMPERAWFVGHLVVMTEDFGIQTWEQMRNRLTSVVWYAVFCEDSFRKLWGEVETKSRILNAQSSSSS